MNNELYAIDSAARFDAIDAPKPAASGVINGRTFTVEYHLVNRKCFDGLATPTASYKIDGKRVSRKTAYEIAGGAL